MSHNENKEKNFYVDWKNNDKIFVPIYLGIVGIAGLIIFLTSHFS